MNQFSLTATSSCCERFLRIKTCHFFFLVKALHFDMRSFTSNNCTLGCFKLKRLNYTMQLTLVALIYVKIKMYLINNKASHYAQ